MIPNCYFDNINLLFPLFYEDYYVVCDLTL